MRRKQFHTFDRPLLLVIVEPILARLEAGNDRMPRCRRMLGCMLARRTVAASDVPTLRTPTKMKPPAVRRRQAFYTSVTARLRSGVDSTHTLFHFPFSFHVSHSQTSLRSHSQPIKNGKPWVTTVKNTVRVVETIDMENAATGSIGRFPKIIDEIRTFRGAANLSTPSARMTVYGTHPATSP
jgi:hypothetical protein